MNAIGRWLRNHPRLLEILYRIARRNFLWARPLLARIGYARADRWLRWSEEVGKKITFDCRMCGQCILHSTGMTCPMTCPKNLRNGPCGGVRMNGNCEVFPEMRCIWVEAYERSRKMAVYGAEIELLQPPVNRLLEGSSAWINFLSGEDRRVPAGWVSLSEIDVMQADPIPVGRLLTQGNLAG